MSLSAVAVRNQRKKRKELQPQLQHQQPSGRPRGHTYPGIYVGALLVADLANVKVDDEGVVLDPCKLLRKSQLRSCLKNDEVHE